MLKQIPLKPFLMIFYGFPGSGKTYFARQFAETVQAAHLQADRVRGELFEEPRYDKQENAITNQMMDYMTEEFLSAGLSVIYDANAARYGQRQMLRDLALKYHAQPILIWIQADIDSCFARNALRDRRKADDKFAAQWDKDSYDKITESMQNPRPSEDFVVISGKHLFSTQKNVVNSSLKRRGVFSSLEVTPNPKVKPGMVNLIPPPTIRKTADGRNIVIR